MRRERGFTFIEMLVTVFVIGLLITLIIPNLLQSKEQAQIEATRASIRGIQEALEIYRVGKKQYPVALDVLVKEDFIDQNKTFDTWGNEYYYKPVIKKENIVTKTYKKVNKKRIYTETHKTEYNIVSYVLFSAGRDCLYNTNDDIFGPVNKGKHTMEALKESNVPADFLLPGMKAPAENTTPEKAKAPAKPAVEQKQATGEVKLKEEPEKAKTGK